MLSNENVDVLIIGAGPSGAVAAGYLRQRGLNVLILEKEQFPRFSIGESLLPQSMACLEESGMLQAVVEAGFQYKNGAAFVWRDRYTDFDFREKYSQGWGTTYQVERARFDDILARQAERMGATLRFRHAVTHIDVQASQPVVDVLPDVGEPYRVTARFVLDASGFGRVLPRLLDLETPSGFPVRGAIFTHVEDGIPAGTFDRNKIRVSVHPRFPGVWYWTIPLSDRRCSLGVVAEQSFLDLYAGSPKQCLQAMVAEEPALHALLANAVWDTQVRNLSGYAANVKSLWGPGYALLGNAGEFLDPVFSSGVTIAVKSASLASDCIIRVFDGKTVDWEQEYAIPLRRGVDTFRTFVDAWYEGRFQKIIFHPHSTPEVRHMISAILAGYAWDTSNPYVADSRRRLSVLEELCSA